MAQENNRREAGNNPECVRMPRRKLCEENTQGILRFFSSLDYFNIVTWTLTLQL